LGHNYDRRDFGQSTPRLLPRAIAVQALWLGIVLFDGVGAIMGSSEFVIEFWNHHPLLAILGICAAILLFAALIEFGISSLRADPT
jgi:hypothetical protein